MEDIFGNVKSINTTLTVKFEGINTRVAVKIKLTAAAWHPGVRSRAETEEQKPNQKSGRRQL